MLTMFDLFSPIFPVFSDRGPFRSPMPSDLREYDDHYELSMDLAGYEKGDIQAELVDGCLTIRAQHRETPDSGDNGRVLRSERFTGTCQRSFYIGEDISREDITANMENGVLTLRIAKAAPQIPPAHRIEIQ